jgi:hypothetical protein
MMVNAAFLRVSVFICYERCRGAELWQISHRRFAAFLEMIVIRYSSNLLDYTIAPITFKLVN